MAENSDNACFEEPTTVSNEAMLAFLKQRRRALIAQAKALDVQRGALLQEADMIAKLTGPKFVVDNKPKP